MHHQSNPLTCPSCKLLFSFQNTPKKLKNCKHNICINCLKSQKKCKIDQIDIDVDKYGFTSYLTNIDILEMIKLEKKGKHNFMQNNEFERQSDKNRLNQSKIRNQLNKIPQQYCLKHHKQLNLICKQQKIPICSICLNSYPHKTHPTISISQLKQTLTKITNNSYEIYDKIKEKQFYLNKNQLYFQIQTFLNKQKTQSQKNIRKMFMKLIQCIREQEAKCIQELNRIKQAKLVKFKQQIIVSFTKIQQEKNLWINSLHYMTNLVNDVYNGTSYDRAILYLNQNSQSQSKLYNQALEIFDKMNNYDLVLKKKLEYQTKYLKCGFDQNILKGIKGFCVFGQKEQRYQSYFRQEIIRQNKDQQEINNQIDRIEYFVNKDLKEQLPQFDDKCQEIKKHQNSTKCQNKLEKKSQQINIQELSNRIFNLSLNKNTDKLSLIKNPFLSCQQSPQKTENYQQQQDFLLNSSNNSIKIQANKIEQISFQQDYSLINHNNVFQSKEFTPILIKENNNSIVEEQQDNQQLQDDKTKVLNSVNLSFNNNYRNYQPEEDSQVEKTVLKGYNNLSKINNVHSSENISSQMISSLNQSSLKNISLSKQKQNSFFSKKSSVQKRSNKLIHSQNYIQSHNKRKIKLQIPQKFIKTWQNAKKDTNQLIDLTGAQLGDLHVQQLCKLIQKHKKLKSLKLIRNKLTDQTLPTLISLIKTSSIQTLNLSQNYFTQKSIQILQEQLQNFSKIKTIILSLNKINLRIVKDKIQKFKQKGIIVSV